MSKLQIYFTIGAVIFLFCGGYVTGCNRAKTQYDAKLAELQQQATEADRQNLEKVLETERAYNEKVNELSQQAQSDISEIEKKYQAAVNELSLINANSVLSDSRRAITSEVCKTASSTTSDDGSKNQSSRNSDAKSKAVIAVMDELKDCDITATYYNQLLKIYSAVAEN